VLVVGVPSLVSFSVAPTDTGVLLQLQPAADGGQPGSGHVVVEQLQSAGAGQAGQISIICTAPALQPPPLPLLFVSISAGGGVGSSPQVLSRATLNITCIPSSLTLRPAAASAAVNAAFAVQVKVIHAAPPSFFPVACDPGLALVSPPPALMPLSDSGVYEGVFVLVCRLLPCTVQHWRTAAVSECVVWHLSVNAYYDMCQIVTCISECVAPTIPLPQDCRRFGLRRRQRQRHSDVYCSLHVRTQLSLNSCDPPQLAHSLRAQARDRRSICLDEGASAAASRSRIRCFNRILLAHVPIPVLIHPCCHLSIARIIPLNAASPTLHSSRVADQLALFFFFFFLFLRPASSCARCSGGRVRAVQGRAACGSGTQQRQHLHLLSRRVSRGFLWSVAARSAPPCSCLLRSRSHGRQRKCFAHGICRVLCITASTSART
jgi:hypothetical protein